MSQITRRDFLKQVGLVAVVGMAAPARLEGLLHVIAGLNQPGGMTGSGASETPQPGDDLPGQANPAAYTTYQLQTPHHALMMDASLADYLSRYTQLVNQGYRAIWVQGAGNGSGAATFSTIWVRDGGGPWYIWVNMDAAGYQTKFNDYGALGYRPISTSGYQDSGNTRFAAIWLYAPGVAYTGIHNATNAQYQTFVNNAINGGYWPMTVDGYPIGVSDYYISIWAKLPSAAAEARHGLTSAQYQSFFDTYAPLGYHVTDVSGYQVNGTTYFAAIMVKDGVNNWTGYHNWLAGDLFNQAVAKAQTDYQPTVIDGYDNGSSRSFAGVWIKRSRAWSTTGAPVPSLASFDSAVQSFMQARNIPSGALAVTRNSQLALARGYRWDYDNVDPVQPVSLFRIASLSKPLTAMVVMRLVQEGHLSLSDKLTSLVTLTPVPGETADPRLGDITVLHLLQHLGGWDRDGTGFDPMFEDLTIAGALGAPLPLNQGNIMAYMTGRPLDFTPGAKYVYSNYGYMLLGRIIEHVTGLSYPQSMQQKVFTPLHISRITLGASLFEARKTNEVAYYTYDPRLKSNVRQSAAPDNVMAAYGGFNLENMDSHGGWLATAPDLARFMTAFDSAGVYPVLNQTSVAQTFAQPAIGMQPDGSWYGCGWVVRNAGGGINTWHDGSLPGTTSLMVRRNDGLSWVVLFNQRDDASGLGYGAIDDALHGAANAVSAWPSGDLFASYGLPTPFQNPQYIPISRRS